MNFYAWIKPPAEDINIYEELGNPGWNWESYQRCTMHTEKYTSLFLEWSNKLIAP